MRCDRLVKLYWAPTGEVQALRGVEAVFRTGAMSAITGPSGSGKSSLLSILALNERQTAGDLEVFGESVSGLSTRRVARLRRQTIAWVPQRASDALLPSLRVREQLDQVANLRGRSVPDDALERLQLEHRRQRATCTSCPAESSSASQCSPPSRPARSSSSPTSRPPSSTTSPPRS